MTHYFPSLYLISNLFCIFVDKIINIQVHNKLNSTRKIKNLISVDLL